MEVAENHWVRLVSCMLEEEAPFWWEAAQRFTFVGTIIWDKLRETFNFTYYLEQVKEQKVRELNNIHYSNLYVRKLVQKFIQLERIAPGLCTTKKAQTNKLIQTLRLALKNCVPSKRPRTLAEAVSMA